MKKILLFLLFLSGLAQLQAQTYFTQEYHLDDKNIGFTDIFETQDGGYMMVGNNTVYTGTSYPIEGGSRYIYLVKTDMNGDTLWTKEHNFPHVVYINKAFLNADESLTFFTESSEAVFCDGFFSLFGYHHYLIRFDNQGNLLESRDLWEECDAIPLDAEETSYGHLAMTWRDDTKAFYAFDINGDSLWYKTHPGRSFRNGLTTIGDVPYSMEAKYNSVTTLFELSVQIFNVQGDLQSEVFIDEFQSVVVKDFTTTADGNLLVLVAAFIGGGFPAPSTTLYKLAPDGTLIWSKIFYSAGEDIDERADGMFYMTHRDRDSPSAERIGITLLSATGDSLITDWLTVTPRNDFPVKVYSKPNLDYISLGTANCCQYDYQFGPAFGTLALRQDMALRLVNVKTPLTPSAVSLQPNPSSGLVNLVLPRSPISKMWVEIYDIAGKKIAQQAIQNSETPLDLSHLPNGLYFYSLWDEGDLVKADKLVLQGEGR